MTLMAYLDPQRLGVKKLSSKGNSLRKTFKKTLFAVRVIVFSLPPTLLVCVSGRVSLSTGEAYGEHCKIRLSVRVVVVVVMFSLLQFTHQTLL